MGRCIPKVIHQTFPNKPLPPPLADSCAHLRRENPDWEYAFYDDDDIEDFILCEYGSRIHSYYSSISSDYGAARADLFRYLLMYQKGGAYIDVKSSCSKPLSSALKLDEGFVLSRWKNGQGGLFDGAGLHPELASFEGGELQQWHIICEPQHPYLAAVIERVIENVREYRPWRTGVGRTGVLRVTGPIAYTLAIEPIKNQHKHIELNSNEDIGLQYSTLGSLDHRVFFRRHYTQMDSPIVSPRGPTRVIVEGYIALRRIKHKLLNLDEDL